MAAPPAIANGSKCGLRWRFDNGSKNTRASRNRNAFFTSVHTFPQEIAPNPLAKRFWKF
jgi:hypothetical protein